MASMINITVNLEHVLRLINRDTRVITTSPSIHDCRPWKALNESVKKISRFFVKEKKKKNNLLVEI